MMQHRRMLWHMQAAGSAVFLSFAGNDLGIAKSEQQNRQQGSLTEIGEST